MNMYRLHGPNFHLFVVTCCLAFVFAAGANNLTSDPIWPNEYMTISRTHDNLTTPLGPLETVQRVASRSEQHGPLYFLAISIWATFTGSDLATLRLVSIYCGLFTVVAVYRMALITGDHQLALFATIITAFTSIYVFFVHELRMYSLVPFCSAWVIGAYWGLQYSRRDRSRWRWISFYLSIAMTMYVHYFGIITLMAVASYHLVFAPKNRQWARIVFVATAAGITFLPWLYLTIGEMMPTYTLTNSRLDALQVLETLLDVYTNGSWYLGLALVAIVVWRFRYIGRQARYLTLLAVFAVGVALLINEITPIWVARRMRYSLVFLPLLAANFAIALAAVPLPRRLRQLVQATVLCLFIVTFFQFNGSDRLYIYTEGARWKMRATPHFQALLYHPSISLQKDQPVVSLHPSVELTKFTTTFFSKRLKPANLVHIYFGDEGKPVIQSATADIPDLDTFVRKFGSFWLTYNPNETSENSMASIFQWARNYYRSCGVSLNGANIVVEHYVRDSDPC